MFVENPGCVPELARAVASESRGLARAQRSREAKHLDAATLKRLAKTPPAVTTHPSPLMSPLMSPHLDASVSKSRDAGDGSSPGALREKTPIEFERAKENPASNALQGRHKQSQNDLPKDVFSFCMAPSTLPPIAHRESALHGPFRLHAMLHQGREIFTLQETTVWAHLATGNETNDMQK